MKLLLIAYYYPPCAGGGVARALHMSIILSKMGVDVTVITAKNHRYDVYDYSLLDEIGKSNVRVIEVGHIWKKRIDSDRLKKDNIKSENEAVGIIHRAKLLLLRILFFVPDSLSDWFFPMAYYMTKINLKNYDIMITTSPPNIAQVIGLLIKVNNRQIKWVSDFRDLWVENSYNTENKFWKLCNNIYEKYVCKKSNLILFTSQKSSDIMKIKYEKYRDKMLYFPNGYYEMELNDYNSQLLKDSNDIIISFTGRIYEERISTEFFSALKMIIMEYPNIFLKIAGPKLPNGIIELIKNSNMLSNVQYLGYINRRDSVRLQKVSNILLNMEFSQEAIPGKIFEYFGTDNFILHVGKLGSASSAIISKYENGIIATDDVQSIYEGLTSILNNLGGKVESKYKYNYERENQIQALIKHIEVAL